MNDIYKLAKSWHLYSDREVGLLKSLQNGDETDIWIDKDSYRSNLNYINLINNKKFYYTAALTTGSSGEPFEMVQSPIARLKKGIEYFSWLSKLRNGSPQILMWRNKQPSLKQRMEIAAGRLKLIPLYDIKDPHRSTFDSTKASEIFATCKPFSGGVLRTYVSVLTWLCQEFGMKLMELNLKAVIASAETLTEKDWNLIEACFGCPCINLYGGTEAAPIAASTLTSRNMYIFKNIFKVNTSKDQNYQRIIVTDYFNYAMPLVSYAIGDLTSGMGEDSNGLYLKDVVGRVSEMIENVRGEKMTSHFVHIVFRDLPEIRRYRLHWHRPGLISLLIETLGGSRISADAYSAITSRFADNGFEIYRMTEGQIEQLDGFKHRAIIRAKL